MFLSLIVHVQTDEDGEDNFSNISIKNFTNIGTQLLDCEPFTLLASQLTGYKESVYFCRRCLCHYSSQSILAKHMEYCIKKKQAPNKMPKQDTVLVLTTINAK